MSCERGGLPQEGKLSQPKRGSSSLGKKKEKKTERCAGLSLIPRSNGNLGEDRDAHPAKEKDIASGAPTYLVSERSLKNRSMGRSCGREKTTLDYLGSRSRRPKKISGQSGGLASHCRSRLRNRSIRRKKGSRRKIRARAHGKGIG